MPKWAMVIDLDKCTGCGDCMAACKLENNIAIVSPEEANSGRVMFWMEMITVYEGEYPDLKVKRFPKPCFHCENPPCIKVCPVYATYINDEGLVGQIYHRCIGCRYCMVACPYTAKVFNWYEPEWPEEFKVFFNPDVSIRMKGVVEREIRDGEYLPACGESCPADAIFFGDMDNKDSKVYRLSRSSRAYKEFEDLGTEPKVIYLSKKE